MTLKEIQELSAAPKKLYDKVKELAPEIDIDAINWEPENHGVCRPEVRPMRKVDVPTGVDDPETNEPGYKTEYQEVNRIPSATNKDIVSWQVRMALGVPVTYKANTTNKQEETILAMVQKTISDNKMAYLDQQIEEKRLIYGYVFEVWYTEPAPKGYWGDIAPLSTFRDRVVILSPADGDQIVPFFDEYKDLIAVARLYTQKIDGKDVEKMELFTSETKTTYTSIGADWQLEGSPVKTFSGKLRGILHVSDRMPTKDVQAKLDRREISDSDTAEENLASGRPLLVATGDISAVGTRASTGKTFQMSGEGADLKYVEPAGAQESINEERKNLITDIYRETSTPDPSIFDSTGTGDIPGISIKLRFTPAINSALSKQQGPIGIAHQRRVNLLKADMAVINKSVESAVTLDIVPVFGIAIPENTKEKYDNVVNLYGAGLMSIKTAITTLGIVENVDEEIEAIEKEVAARALLNQPKPTQPVS